MPIPDYLRSVYGLDIPGGFTARKFGRAEILGQLLSRLGAPTGLENFYGPQFQSRAISGVTERTTQPFQEAGRALTGSYLRTGQGGGGQLAAGRGQLARAQEQTTGSSIADLLLGMQGARAEHVLHIEDIRVE